MCAKNKVLSTVSILAVYIWYHLFQYVYNNQSGLELFLNELLGILLQLRWMTNFVKLVSPNMKLISISKIPVVIQVCNDTWQMLIIMFTTVIKLPPSESGGKKFTQRTKNLIL